MRGLLLVRVVDGYATGADLKLESPLTESDRGTQTIVKKITKERRIWAAQNCSPSPIWLTRKNVHSPHAVSYTHLDVYKRQAQEHPGVRCAKRNEH